MSAQELWKTNYRKSKSGVWPSNAAGRGGMSLYRREAALERKLAAAQRTIEALTFERDDYKMHFEACDLQRLEFLDSLMRSRAERDESSRQLKSRAEFTDYLERTIEALKIERDKARRDLQEFLSVTLR